MATTEYRGWKIGRCDFFAGALDCVRDASYEAEPDGEGGWNEAPHSRITAYSMEEAQAEIDEIEAQHWPEGEWVA